MAPSVSLVLVTYRSSQVIETAIASFRAAARLCDLDTEVITVDHSGDGDEVGLLQRHADRVVVQPNRGYAAGINAGLAVASGETLVVGNPDVRFEPGSLAALMDALESGWHVVGPQFILDEFRLPPADRQTPLAEGVRRISGASRPLWRLLLSREVKRWWRVWNATGPVAQAFLSGALLAFRREVAARLGRWDENYFLYFEETDWLLRARRAGLRGALVPDARVEHYWGHAAVPERHSTDFETSRARYFTKNFGFLGRISMRVAARQPRWRFAPFPAGTRLCPGRVLWLVSPATDGFHAAGWVGGGDAPVEQITRAARRCGGRRPTTLMAWDLARGKLIGAWGCGTSDG